MCTNCLACFSVCINPLNSKALALGWPQFSALYIVTEARFGPRGSWMAARLFISRLRNHKDSYGNYEQTGRILLVEDDPKDVELTLTALEEYNLVNEVIVARDGEEALDYLYCRGEYKSRSSDNPAVMLLDLKLPKVDGWKC